MGFSDASPKDEYKNAVKEIDAKSCAAAEKSLIGYLAKDGTSSWIAPERKRQGAIESYIKPTALGSHSVRIGSATRMIRRTMSATTNGITPR